MLNIESFITILLIGMFLPMIGVALEWLSDRID